MRCPRRIKKAPAQIWAGAILTSSSNRLLSCSRSLTHNRSWLRSHSRSCCDGGRCHASNRTAGSHSGDRSSTHNRSWTRSHSWLLHNRSLALQRHSWLRNRSWIHSHSWTRNSRGCGGTSHASNRTAGSHSGVHSSTHSHSWIRSHSHRRNHHRENRNRPSRCRHCRAPRQRPGPASQMRYVRSSGDSSNNGKGTRQRGAGSAGQEARS